MTGEIYFDDLARSESEMVTEAPAGPVDRKVDQLLVRRDKLLGRRKVLLHGRRAFRANIEGVERRLRRVEQRLAQLGAEVRP